MTVCRFDTRSANAARPSLQLAPPGGATDDFLHLTLDPGQATSVDVSLGVLYDGVTYTIPLTISPSGGGAPLTPIAPGPIVIDPAARTAWEQTWGVATVGSVNTNVAPALQPLPVDHCEHVVVPDPPQHAHLVGVRVGCQLFLGCIGQQRRGPAPAHSRQSRSGDQDLAGGKHQFDPRCRVRQLCQCPTSGMHTGVLVQQHPSA